MGIISYQINPYTFFNWLKIHLISHSPIKVNSQYMLNIAGITYIIKYLEREHHLGNPSLELKTPECNL